MTRQSLITYLRIDHSFYPSTKFKLACAQVHCRRQFSIYSGFKKHLICVHERDVSESGDSSNLVNESFQANFHVHEDIYRTSSNKCQAQPRG